MLKKFSPTLILLFLSIQSTFQQYFPNSYPQVYPQQPVYGPQLPQHYVPPQQQVQIQQSSQCSYMPNVDYFGNDLPGSPCPARSIDECCALCLANPHCQAWTFVCDPNPECSTCFLKSCVGSDIRCVPNRYSGVKPLVPTTTCIQTTQNLLCSYLYIC